MKVFKIFHSFSSLRDKSYARQIKNNFKSKGDKVQLVNSIRINEHNDANQQIHIRNEDQLNEKINCIKQDPQDLDMISNFSSTIAINSQQQQMLSPFDILNLQNYSNFADHHKAQYQVIMEQYKDYQDCKWLHEQRKGQKLSHIYSEIFQLIATSKLDQQDLYNMIDQSDLKMRAEIDVLLKLALQFKIPLYIIDEGISNLIDSGLNPLMPEYKNFKYNNVISNSLIWDRNVLRDMHPLFMVTKLNKLQLLYAKQQRDKFTPKSNCILLGSTLYDNFFTSNYNQKEQQLYKQILSIGFMDKNINGESSVNDFLEQYDIVIEGEGSFRYCNDLLKSIYEESADEQQSQENASIKEEQYQ